jgi:hypothetical protein
VLPAQCSYNVLGTKLEIVMTKADNMAWVRPLPAQLKDCCMRDGGCMLPVPAVLCHTLHNPVLHNATVMLSRVVGQLGA